MSATVDGPRGPLLVPDRGVYACRGALEAWAGMGNTGGKETLLRTLALCESWEPADHDEFACSLLAPRLGLRFFCRLKGLRAAGGPSLTRVVDVLPLAGRGRDPGRAMSLRLRKRARARARRGAKGDSE